MKYGVKENTMLDLLSEIEGNLVDAENGYFSYERYKETQEKLKAAIRISDDEDLTDTLEWTLEHTHCENYSRALYGILDLADEWRGIQS